MEDKQFKAILAKNEIARALKEYKKHSEVLHIDYIISNLKDIEKFIGQLNQPSIDEIMDSKMHI
jgi:hypothetical protein